MTTQRSPTQLPTGVPATLVANTQVGGSQPDLSKLSQLYTDPQITLRKRKKPEDCECSNNMKQMQSELSRMNSLLERYFSSNEQNIQKIQDDLANLKTEVLDIKASNEQISNVIRENVNEMKLQVNAIEATTSDVLAEQKILKNQVSRLENSFAQGDKKLQAVESEINRITKTTPNGMTDSQVLSEQSIQELHNRYNREKNVLLVGIPEPKSLNMEERSAIDEAEVLRIISSISTDTPKPTKVFRIGKQNPGKNRSIKVCFSERAPAKELLKNKSRLPAGIKIYSDQTPAQQKYLKTLKEELQRREAAGENDLTIKYISGTPTIVKTASKNSKQHNQTTKRTAQTITPMKY